MKLRCLLDGLFLKVVIRTWPPAVIAYDGDEAFALDALEALRVELERRGIVLALARVKQDVRDALVAGDFIARVGEQHVFMTLPTAVQAYAAWCEARHGQPLPEIEGMPAAIRR